MPAPYADFLRSRGYEHAKALGGSDTAFSPAFDAILVGVAGNVKIDTVGGETVILPLPVGISQIRGTKIYTGSTTATGVFGLWSQVGG